MILKNRFRHLRKVTLLVFLLHLPIAEGQNHERIEDTSVEISSLGAVMSEPLLEGGSGAIRRSPRYRFKTLSIGPTPGILGQFPKFSQSSLRDQPGVLPGPLLGFDSLEFTFTCLGPVDQDLFPIIVEPDGSIIKGKILCSKNPKQTLTVPYPAQTGIYTLFVSNSTLEKRTSDSVRVDVAVHKQVKGGKTTNLPPFNLSTQSIEESAIELIYTAFNSQIELF